MTALAVILAIPIAACVLLGFYLLAWLLNHAYEYIARRWF